MGVFFLCEITFFKTIKNNIFFQKKLDISKKIIYTLSVLQKRSFINYFFNKKNLTYQKK